MEQQSELCPHGYLYCSKCEAQPVEASAAPFHLMSKEGTETDLIGDRADLVLERDQLRARVAELEALAKPGEARPSSSNQFVDSNKMVTQPPSSPSHINPMDAANKMVDIIMRKQSENSPSPGIPTKARPLDMYCGHDEVTAIPKSKEVKCVDCGLKFESMNHWAYQRKNYSYSLFHFIPPALPEAGIKEAIEQAFSYGIKFGVKKELGNDWCAERKAEILNRFSCLSQPLETGIRHAIGKILERIKDWPQNEGEAALGVELVEGIKKDLLSALSQPAETEIFLHNTLNRIKNQTICKAITKNEAELLKMLENVANIARAALQGLGVGK